MKPATVITLGIAVSMLISSLSDAQQTPIRVPSQIAPAQNSVQAPQTRVRRAEPATGRSEQTFQMLDFTFWTGGDDLRNDSAVTASFTFPDGARQACYLHGSQASGGAANISWDNNSMHDAPPCRLDKPRTLRELKDTKIVLQLWAPGSVPNPVEAIFAGPLALTGFRSQDNWDINRVIVKAFNQNSSGHVCVSDVSGNPVARLTGSQPQVALSGFENQCR